MLPCRLLSIIRLSIHSSLFPRSLFNNHWRGDVYDASGIIIWACSAYAKWQMCWQKSNKQTWLMTNRSFCTTILLYLSLIWPIWVTGQWVLFKLGTAATWLFIRLKTCAQCLLSVITTCVIGFCYGIQKVESCKKETPQERGEYLYCAVCGYLTSVHLHSIFLGHWPFLTPVSFQTSTSPSLLFLHTHSLEKGLRLQRITFHTWTGAHLV